MNKNYTVHDLVMKRPASAFCHRWMDGTPIGSGKTGIILYGGVSAEHFIINRNNLWYCGQDAPIPDVSFCLEKMRRMEKEGKGKDAHKVMYNELISKGYNTTLADMRVLGNVKILFETKGVYSDYRRVLHMDTSEAQISYKVDGKAFCRRSFMSRKRDIAATLVTSEEKTSFKLKSGFFKTLEGKRENTLEALEKENAEYRSFNDCYIYSSVNEGKYYGIVCKIVSDGQVLCTKDGITVENSSKSLILIKAFSEEDNRKQAETSAVKEVLQCPENYETLFKENLPDYQKYYFSADISLYDKNEFHTNEYLFDEARDNEISAELAEKTWRFGRYFFISSTSVDGLPCPLYGLWPSGYERQFTHHVANENVQSIYWHTDVGGLSELVVPLIGYYYGKMDSFKENARKLFDCDGIFIGTYTTPKNGAVAWYVPVILHFVGVAGWLSSHFYKYYRFTRDEKLFNEKILPFMLETIKFYEDYYYTDDNGKLVLYPAVSPENSPVEYFSKTEPGCYTVTKNPTVEIAILKELITNLLEVSKSRTDLSANAEKWKYILSILPDYTVNGDGAVSEWIDADITDRYDHRHISHLYPVFPGTEIEDSGDKTLLPAFKKATDLRGSGSFCGWSMPHMSAIYSRLRDAKKAFATFNSLFKVCMLENFFTLGYDFRDMGITGYDCGDEISLPVQFDALLSSVNALQEMLLFSTDKVLRLLPACPEQFAKGKATLRFNSGIVEFSWNLADKKISGNITALHGTEFNLELPFGIGSKSVTLKKDEKYSF